MRLMCILLGILVVVAGRAAAASVVYFPTPEMNGDARLGYAFAMLQLALEKSHADYRVTRTRDTMVQSRALAELAHRTGRVQVVASMTSREREAQLLPVRIPIDKGLIGWRVPLLMNARATMFKDVRRADQLATLTAGQEADWPDTAILRANHLKVVTSATYPSLFKMLVAGRFDYFPRSVMEIEAEARQYREADIVIDAHLALHYPAAIYFFVNPSDRRLAEAIRRGLEAAIADGSFDRLFNAYYGTIVEQFDLAHRTVIELDNPLLTIETPLARRELWLSAVRHGRR
jgi:hypothetical protein